LDTTQRTSAEPLRGRQRDEGSGRAGRGFGRRREDRWGQPNSHRRQAPRMGIRCRWFSAAGT